MEFVSKIMDVLIKENIIVGEAEFRRFANTQSLKIDGCPVSENVALTFGKHQITLGKRVYDIDVR